MQMYAHALYAAFNKEIDFDTDNIVATLHSASYTPNLDTDAYVSDLTNEVPNGSGYTTGGQSVTSASRTLVAANSWSVQWAATTAYVVDNIVRPTSGNGFVYRCAVAGTSGGSQPTWPTTIGTTVTDGGVTWECVGKRVLVLTATFPSWTGATFSARYLVLSDRTPGSAAAQPLIGLFDAGSNVAVTSSTWQYTPNSQGALILTLP